MAAERYAGFSPDAIQFLADLAANNERSWFQPRKAEYERLLKVPLEELCVALGERLAARGVPMRSDPTRSPFRIYRDTRFSRDKSPYKTHVSASFPWLGDASAGPGGGEVDGGVGGAASAARGEAESRTGVGGYFHFQPGEMYVGGGMWHPDPARLAAWRTRVASDSPAVHAAIEAPAFVGSFGSVDGERLKRVPAGYAADHPEAELLKLKDVTFGRRLSDAEALSPDLPDTLAEAFVAASPVLGLLAALGS